MSARKPAARAASDLAAPAPYFTTQHRVDFHICVDMPQLADLLAVLGGRTIADTLARLEQHMLDFDKKMDTLEKKLDEFDAREAKEDEDFVLSKAENKKLKEDLAALQAEIEASGSTPEREARFAALLERIDNSNKVDSEVLPEPTPEPEPTPPPDGGGEIPVEEVPPG